jgi:hypothetical protein
MRPLADNELVDLSRYPCARQEALRRIRRVLDEEVRAGVRSDMARYMTISSLAGETLLEVPFRDALSCLNLQH